MARGFAREYLRFG